MLGFIAQHAHEVEGALAEYWELLNSPGHWMFELTLQLLIDGLLIGVGWKLAKAYYNKRHSTDISEAVEAEHEYHGVEDGHDHKDDLENKVEALTLRVKTLEGERHE